MQCGRRMFLAALILASKYLQDRNYSSRAWSKISGLSTAEINQNESAFLHAISWRLHVTNEVYNRWIECVNNFNSPRLPPSPGSAVVDGFEQRCLEFRTLIQKLSPSLENLEELNQAPTACIIRRSSTYQLAAGALSPVSFCSSPDTSASSPLPVSSENTPSTSKVSGVNASFSNSYGYMQHSPATPTFFTAGRAAPALGRLPTPKSIPHQHGMFNCQVAPAATTGPSSAQILAGSRSSMCFAVAQASSASATQILDRWPPALSSSLSSNSPMGATSTRRSSLANSVSSASSPESMISDSSHISRSSSVTSAWSLMNAPNVQLPKLDAQARPRFPKQQWSSGSLREKSCFGLKTSGNIPAAVPEDYEISNNCSPALCASPETISVYAGSTCKDSCGPVRRSSDLDATAAACALAVMQQQPVLSVAAPFDSGKPHTSLKRSRPMSGEANVLQDNLRGSLRNVLLNGASGCGLEAVAMAQNAAAHHHNQQQNLPVALADLDLQTATRAAALTGSRKRLCRTTSTGVVPTATTSVGTDPQYPSKSGLCGRDTWQGILN